MITTVYTMFHVKHYCLYVYCDVLCKTLLSIWIVMLYVKHYYLYTWYCFTWNIVTYIYGCYFYTKHCYLYIWILFLHETLLPICMDAVFIRNIVTYMYGCCFCKKYYYLYMVFWIIWNIAIYMDDVVCEHSHIFYKTL
mgnify:CR=1 FL=1